MNLLEKYKTLHEKNVSTIYDERTGLTVVRYLHPGLDFSDPELRMARSLALTEDGDIAIRGFGKFFNHLQYDNCDWVTEEFKEQFTRMGDIETTEKITFFEKIDGTCITVSSYNGKLVATTTRRIRWDKWNRAVLEIISKNKKTVEWLHANPDMNLIFEYTSPSHPIVIKYPEEKVTLIGVTHNETGTLHPMEAYRIGQELNLPLPRIFHMTMQEIANSQAHAENIEGYIALNKYGHLIKFKTDDWLKHFRAQTSGYSGLHNYKGVRTVLDAYRNDQLDDLMGRQNELVAAGYPDQLTPILTAINEIVSEAEAAKEELETNITTHGKAEAMRLHATNRNYHTSPKGIAVEMLDGKSLYDTLKARTTIPKTLVLYIIQKLGIREEWNE